MKGKISLALLILAVVSALSFYVSAQAQTDKKQEELQKALRKIQSQSQPEMAQGQLERLQKEKENAVRETLLVDPPLSKGIILLQSNSSGDAKAFFYCTKPSNSNIRTTAKIRIEMIDGSVQELPVSKVKTITIE